MHEAPAVDAPVAKTWLELEFADGAAPERIEVRRLVDAPVFAADSPGSGPWRAELPGPEAYVVDATMARASEPVGVQAILTVERPGAVALRLRDGTISAGRRPWGVVWPIASVMDDRSAFREAAKEAGADAAKDSDRATARVRAVMADFHDRVESEADPERRAVLAASAAGLFGRQVFDQEDGIDIEAAELAWVLEEIPLDHEVWGAMPMDLLNTLLMFGAENVEGRAKELRRSSPYAGVAAATVMAELEWAKMGEQPERYPQLLARLEEIQPGGFLSKLAHDLYDPKRVLAPGQSMPKFSFERFDEPGAVVTRDSLEGHPALIYIWSTWCSACKRKMPLLQRASEVCPDVAFVSLAEDDDPEPIRTFQRKYGGADWINVSLGAAGTAITRERWGVVAVPETLLLDETGKIVANGREFAEVDDVVGALRARGWCEGS